MSKYNISPAGVMLLQALPTKHCFGSSRSHVNCCNTTTADVRHHVHEKYNINTTYFLGMAGDSSHDGDDGC